MKIDDIIEEWKKDSVIDSVELDRESMHIPNLHAKYLAVLSSARRKRKGFIYKKRILERDLKEYYKGDLNNPEDLTRIKRDPWERKLLKQDVDSYVEADNEIIELDGKIDMQSEIIYVLEEIIKAINNRGFQISTAVKWRALTQFSGDA